MSAATEGAGSAGGPAVAGQRIIKLAVLAVGGQGGGVLSDWITATAEANGWRAQSTSVPGVAQRTGATVYYIEMVPDEGRQPVFSLMPTPGDVDIVVAATFVSDDGDAPKAEASMPVVVASMTPDDTAPNDQSVPSAARTEEIRRAQTEETDEESNSTAPSLLPAYTEVWDVAHLDPSHVPFLEMLDRHAAKGQRLTMAFVFSPFKLVKVLELMTETLDHGKGPCRSRYFATFTECAEQVENNTNRFTKFVFNRI
mgnify:CR=1 FL=1